jgi:AmmeMemoRadiSam system protein A
VLDERSRRDLLWLARTAIARVIGAQSPAAPDRIYVPFDVRAGVFVTLRAAGRLRGCIGYPEPDLPLVDAVTQCAVSAAMSDPRFPSLGVEEFCGIDIEISVLGAIEPVADIAEVVAGRHGLIVEHGRCRGLLLPQVAVEWNWTVLDLASQTSQKAGLHRDAWQNGAKLFRFEAEVFGDREGRAAS